MGSILLSALLAAPAVAQESSGTITRTLDLELAMTVEDLAIEPAEIDPSPRRR